MSSKWRFWRSLTALNDDLAFRAACHISLASSSQAGSSVPGRSLPSGRAEGNRYAWPYLGNDDGVPAKLTGRQKRARICNSRTPETKTKRRSSHWCGGAENPWKDRQGMAKCMPIRQRSQKTKRSEKGTIQDLGSIPIRWRYRGVRCWWGYGFHFRTRTWLCCFWRWSGLLRLGCSICRLSIARYPFLLYQ